MINKIIDFSINNKFVVGLLTVILIGLGIRSMTRVPIDAVPDITNNQVQVITQSPNLGTEDMEQFVTYPIEVAMSNLPMVKEIRSISRSGLSVVTIVFDDDMKTYLPRQLVSEKLIAVQEQIPSGFGTPFMGPISTGLGEIYQYTLDVADEFKETYSITELRTIQDWIVRRQMSMVPGVIEINAFGGNQKQYEVAIDPAKLNAIGISISEVYKALESNNENSGGAYIIRNHQANFIRGEGLARTTQDIENIVIKNVDGLPIKIKDIGTVGIGSAVRYGALTKDGKGEAVGGMILMLKGANSNAVIEKVTQRMEQIQKSLPEGITIKPFLDRSELIKETTGTVTGNLFEGGLIVIFILVLLLGNWRGGLIVASTIPLSLLFAFILMDAFGVWANLMSLGAIDFGIIIDGAVIIVESTVFLLYQKTSKAKGSPLKNSVEIAATASKKMMNTAFFGQLIILIVFLPILVLEGVEGKMFQPMALTFIFAMIGAMLLCLTYVPMVSSLFLKVSSNRKKTYGDRFVKWVENRYAVLLQKALRKRITIISAALILFVISIMTFTKMGGEFIPQLDEGDIAFHALLKPGSALSETIATTTKIEGIIKAKFPEVETVISRIGVADVPTDPMPMDLADIFVILKPKNTWVSANSKDELIEKIKEVISRVPGVNYEFTQPIEMRFNELLTGVREDVAIKLFGEDLQILTSKAEEMGKIIANVPGVADMKVEATTGLPQITINYNRNKLAQYGLDINSLNTMVQTAFAGGRAGVIFEGEKRFDLVVRLPENHRKDIDDILQLFIDLPNGSQIPLSTVATVSYNSGPMQISRDNTNRRTYVGVNIRNRDVKSVVEDIKLRLDAQLKLPPGYYIRYGGAFENLERANDRLSTVVPIALLLIFVLIYFALKSFSQTLMIYFAIPMATIGGVCALWLRDMPFSISAGVGFIVLFGVAVLNGLVMISGLNELKEEGVIHLNDRIAQGTKRRIRPILLTAFTDILGFLPMAISTSAGAEVQQPLATVVIGGLLTSTLLTLFILPILYHWIEQRQLKIGLNKKWISGLTVLFLFSVPSFGQAQEMSQDSLPIISLKEALVISKKNYPLLQTKRIEIEKQLSKKSTIYDFGTTRLFTGGEEISRERGVYTSIGFSQQNIALLAISAQKQLQKERVKLAEAIYGLTELQFEKEIKHLWSMAFKAKKKYDLYKEMHGIYTKLLKLIELQLEVEAISELTYASAKSEALLIKNSSEQAKVDYDIALHRFNLWLVADTFYAVPDSLNDQEFSIAITDFQIQEHPDYILAQQRLSESKANYKALRANLLPKLNLRGGVQRVNGTSGFYSYQAGISIPLLSGPVRALPKAAKLDQEIAAIDMRFAQRQLQSNYQIAMQNYLKWHKSLQLYQNDILPLAKEQREGALLAYKEGELQYTAFAQMVNVALKTEMQGLTIIDSYFNALFELQYFKN